MTAFCILLFIVIKFFTYTAPTFFRTDCFDGINGYRFDTGELFTLLDNSNNLYKVRIEWPEQDVYEGYFRNGKAFGTGVYRGKFFCYEGKFLNWKFHGYGKLKIYSKGINQTYDGYFNNDFIIGDGFLTDSQGYRFKGELGYPDPTFNWQIHYKNGDRFYGHIDRYKMKIGMKGIYYFNNNDYYNGSFSDGNFNGTSIIMLKSNDYLIKYEGGFLNGDLFGKGTMTISNSVIREVFDVEYRNSILLNITSLDNKNSQILNSSYILSMIKKLTLPKPSSDQLNHTNLIGPGFYTLENGLKVSLIENNLLSFIYGQLIRPDNVTLIGGFKKYELSDYGKVIDPKSDCEYEGAVNSLSKPHGFGKCTYHNGTIYKGNWRNGLKHGKGSVMDAKEIFYSGSWSDGIFQNNSVIA